MDDVPLAKFQNSFSIFDYDEIDLIEKAKDLVNIPCRIFNCNDCVCSLLSFSKNYELLTLGDFNPICIQNDLITFLNEHYNIGSTLVIKSLINYCKEFNTSGFEAPSIYFNYIDICDSLLDNVGRIESNNIRFHIGSKISNSIIHLYDLNKYINYNLKFDNNSEVDYKKYCENSVRRKDSTTSTPCLEIVSDSKDVLELSNWSICSENLGKIIIRSSSSIQLNNFKTNNIESLILEPKDTQCKLSKQIFNLFISNYEFDTYNNYNDCIERIKIKNMSNLIDYYRNYKRYSIYNTNLPYSLKNINMYEILDIRDCIGLNNIIIKYPKSLKIVFTKDYKKAFKHYNWQYRESILKGELIIPSTLDGWYIYFENTIKEKER